MNEKMKQERVFVFIDGSNLYHGLKNHLGSGKAVPINVRKLCELLSGTGRRLVRILYYTAPVKQQENKESYRRQQTFLSKLRQISFLDLRLGRLVKRSKEFECEHCNKKTSFNFHNEKGVDVFIASDLLVHAFDDQYDTAILVSEDGDFVPAVQEVQRLSKKVENAYFKTSYLSKKCDRFIELTSAVIADVRIKSSE